MAKSGMSRVPEELRISPVVSLRFGRPHSRGGTTSSNPLSSSGESGTNSSSTLHDRLLDRTALWRERSDDDPVNASPKERHDVVRNFFDGSSEG